LSGSVLNRELKMKGKKVFLSLIIFIFLIQPSSWASSRSSSQALEKVPDIYLTVYDIEEYVDGKFSTQEIKAYNLSTKDIRETEKAIDAGWSAFNQNFNLQGAGFTFLESCLGASFLENINSACGEVGGGLVLLQLAIDLYNKDYKAANINFGKGSIYYCISKWGTTALKVGSIGAVLVEWYLTSFANAAYAMHDEYFQDALVKYYRLGPAKRKLKEWKKIFLAANGGKGVKNKDEVLKIIDEYVEEHWEIKHILGWYKYQKDGTIGGYARDTTPRFRDFEKDFKRYLKSIAILPYLKPLFRRMAAESRKNEMQKIVEQFNFLVKRLNREYTVRGKVKGPREEIQGLKVRIPDFVETVTGSGGEYEFRFTLYSLSKARAETQNHSPYIKIELEIPTEGGVRYQYRKGRIKESHHKSGRIRIKPFDLEEVMPGECQIPFTEEKINSFIEKFIKEAETKFGIKLTSLTKQYIACGFRDRAYGHNQRVRSAYISSFYSKEPGEVGTFSNEDIVKIDFVKAEVEEFRKLIATKRSKCKKIESEWEHERYTVHYCVKACVPFIDGTKVKIPFTTCAGWEAYKKKFWKERNIRVRMDEKLYKKQLDIHGQYGSELAENDNVPGVYQLVIDWGKTIAEYRAIREKRCFKEAEYYKYTEPYGDKLCREEAEREEKKKVYPKMKSKSRRMPKWR